MSLRARLLLLVFMPFFLLPLALYSPWQTLQKDSKTTNSMQRALQGMIYVDILLDSLQKERQKAIEFLVASQTSQEKEKIYQQAQEETYKNLKELIAYQKNIPIDQENLQKLLEDIQALLEKIHKNIKDTSKNQDALGLEMIEQYSTINKKLLEIYRQISNSPTAKAIGKVFTSIATLEVSKENLAKLASLIHALEQYKHTEHFENHLPLVFSSYSLFSANVNSPSLALGKESQKKLQALAQAPKTQEIEQFLFQALSQKEFAAQLLSHIEHVYIELTRFIHAENQALTKRLQDIAQEESQTFQTYTLSAVSIAILFAALLSFLAKLVVRAIRSPIYQATTQLASLASETQTSVETLSQAAKRISDATTNIAASLEETSATMSLFSESIAHNAHTATYGEDLAHNAQQTLQRVEKETHMLAEAIENIAKSSNDIINIVEIMNSITTQTTLLAFNAQIEAVRSGDQGKGFAVVAESIHNLSKRSTEATQNIKAIIENIYGSLQNGKRIAYETQKSLEEIITELQNMIEVVQTLARSAKEQKESVMQVKSAVQSIDSASQSNAQTAESLAHLAEVIEENMKNVNTAIAQLTKLM